MSNIPLDPNGVQPGYTVVHNSCNESLSKETPFCELWRSNERKNELNFTYWEKQKDIDFIDLPLSIAVFRLKFKKNIENIPSSTFAVFILKPKNNE